MNKFTKRKDFLQSAEDCLKSDLLCKKNCLIVGGVLYERLYRFKCKYRFFFSDDYDYVVDKSFIKALDVIFKRFKISK